MGSLSIVIPTYNRETILAKVLEALLRQSHIKEVEEILVVDDGSTDGTAALVATVASRSPVPIRHLHQAHQGPAAARNLGLREARARIVLFADDDIVPAPALVAAHLAAHERRADSHIAILGKVDWSPEVRVTPFMRWLGSKGPIFAYARIARLPVLDFRYFYTCNVSLKTGFIRQVGSFDQDFPSASYEDLEFGYRLQERGMRLYYEPSAVGYHYQTFSLEQASRRGRKALAARDVFKRKEAGASMRARHNTLWWKVLSRVAPVVAFPLLPLRPLLDSMIPLPPFVYLLLYNHEVKRDRALP